MHSTSPKWSFTIHIGAIKRRGLTGARNGDFLTLCGNSKEILGSTESIYQFEELSNSTTCEISLGIPTFSFPWMSFLQELMLKYRSFAIIG